jgi:CHAT domain-containing protein
MYAGAFALFLIACLIGLIFLLRPNQGNELAELKNIYQKERPFETRVSDFDYAPVSVTRGENEKDDVEKRKLKLIETKLLEAVDKNANANNHNNLGIFYLSQGKYDEAIKELNEAVKLEPNNVKFHNDLGSAYFEKGKNGEKEKKFLTLSQANEEFSKAIELNPNYLEAIFNKSLYLQENQLFNEAKKSWELYLQKDSNSKWADEARKNLEKISQLQGSLQKKKDEILNDFFVAYKNKDEKQIWKIHNSTKGFFVGISLADQLTKRFLDAKKNKDDPTASESLEALNYIGNLEKEKHADFFFADLANFYSNIDEAKIDKTLEAKELLKTAYNFIDQTKYTQSIETYAKARDLFLQIGNEPEADAAESWRLQMLNDVGKNEEVANGSIKLNNSAEEKNYKVISAIAMEWLANAQFKLDQYTKSIESSKKHQKIAEETENFYAQRQSYDGLASSYLVLAETSKSAFYYGKAIENYDYYVNPSQFWRNLSTGNQLIGKLGNYSTSIDFGKETLAFLRESPNTQMKVNSYRVLGYALAEKKLFDEALNSANEAIKITENLENSDEKSLIQAEAFLLNANVNLKAKNYAEALNYFDKSLQLYSEKKDVVYYLYEIHKGKLVCFQQLKRQAAFEKELEIVLNLSEENRQKIREDNLRQTFFSTEQDVYDVAIANALEQKNSQKAFEYGEISRGRSLLDFVKSDKSIVELENEFGEISKPLTLKEIQTQMPENVQILQYSLLENKLAIWLITKNRFELSEKPINLSEFEQKISDYRKAVLGKKDVETIKKSAKELYELLIPNTLESGKILCLIPDKSLYQIPFASLLSPAGKYLIEDFALLYNPSSSVFIATTENSKSKSSNEKLLSIGNPNFDKTENSNLKDLPEAEIEAKEIAKNYQNNQKFIGNDATKQTFLDSFVNAEIIHFAGHFVVNNESPSNSKMLFADTDLRSSELTKTKLKKAKLVVLSACETGFEKFNKSEGSIGIARTFLAIGSPLVVASNWKVDSEATKNLMISFHRKRTQEKLSSIEALRQAQLEMLKTNDLSSPYFWSAFTINGGNASY